MTVVKSLRETHPDFGSTSGPLDFHRYVDGRAQVVFVCATTIAASVSNTALVDASPALSLVSLIVVFPLTLAGRTLHGETERLSDAVELRWRPTGFISHDIHHV